MTDALIQSLQLGITPAIVVGVYLIINKIIDSRKELKHIKINREVAECFTNLNNFLNKVTKELIDKEHEKCIFAIKTSFKSSANSIIKFATHTIITNNVEVNKNIVLDNINNLVTSEYYELYSNLILYKVGNIKVAEFLKKEWKDEIKKDLTEIIFNHELTTEEKLYNANNRINIKISNYGIYVINKYKEYDE